MLFRLFNYSSSRKDAIQRLFVHTVEINEGSIVWEEGEDCDDFSHLASTPLSKLPGGGVREGSMVQVEDFIQQLEIQIVIKHVDKDKFDEEKYPDLFSLTGEKPVAKEEKAPAASETVSKADMEIVDLDEAEVVVAENQSTKKRLRNGEGEADASPPVKKQKTEADDEEIEIVMLE